MADHVVSHVKHTADNTTSGGVKGNIFALIIVYIKVGAHYITWMLYFSISGSENDGLYVLRTFFLIYIVLGMLS
jgi:hypothetical protein